MAIVVTEPVAEVITTANQDSYSFGSFTPSASSLIVIAGFMNASQAMICTDTAGLTWTVGGGVQTTDFAGRWWYSLAPLTPSAMTVTVTRAATDATPTYGYLQAFQFLGVDTGGLIVQAASGTASSSDFNITFSTNLQTQNAYFAAVHNLGTSGSDAFSPPTGWTEAADGSFTAPSRACGAAYRSKGETGTTATYHYIGSVATIWLAGEIKAAPDRGHQVIWML